MVHFGPDGDQGLPLRHPTLQMDCDGLPRCLLDQVVVFYNYVYCFVVYIVQIRCIDVYDMRYDIVQVMIKFNIVGDYLTTLEPSTEPEHSWTVLS